MDVRAFRIKDSVYTAAYQRDLNNAFSLLGVGAQIKKGKYLEYWVPIEKKVQAQCICVFLSMHSVDAETIHSLWKRTTDEANQLLKLLEAERLVRKIPCTPQPL